MTYLIELADGIWVNPASVTSIVAYGAGKYQAEPDCRVIVCVGSTTVHFPQHDFKTAHVYANQLAEWVNGDDQP